MLSETIDYEGLKKRGFLRQKQDGFFVLRTRQILGVYANEHLEKLAEISRKYAKGFVHATTRQGIEIPFIKLEDIPDVEKELEAVGVKIGALGACVRTITSCPGNNWCKLGLINTFSFCEKIEKQIGVKSGLELPGKFKMAVSGCLNSCTRVQFAEIGVHGQVDVSSPDKRVGYAVYLGGCGGRAPKQGLKVDRILTEEETLNLIQNVVMFFKNNAKPKQRLAALIDEAGKEEFFRQIKL